MNKTEKTVSQYLSKLEHPLLKEIELLRSIIVSVDKNIVEEIKWNSLSYRISDFFATINLHSKSQIRIILHRGAKKSGENDLLQEVPDPAGILKWLDNDRAMITFECENEIHDKRYAFEDIIRNWIQSDHYSRKK